jgi:hypothetical protein
VQLKAQNYQYMSRRSRRRRSRGIAARTTANSAEFEEIADSEEFREQRRNLVLKFVNQDSDLRNDPLSNNATSSTSSFVCAALPRPCVLPCVRSHHQAANGRSAQRSRQCKKNNSVVYQPTGF